MDDRVPLAGADAARWAELGEQAAYYRQIAELSGQRRLREVEQLNRHIAARRRSESALRENEQRFRLIAQSTNDIFYEWQIASGAVRWFGDIDGALGHAAGTIGPSLEDWLRVIHPADRPVMDEAVRLHTEDIRPIDYTFRVICQDGTVRTWRMNGSPLLHPDGRPHAWVGGVIDVTERKRAEEALIHAQRLSAIGELASGVAHDFNNTLQGISGNIELALLRDLSPEVRAYLEATRRSVSEAAARIKQLQRFSRRGERRRGHGPLEVSGLVEEVIEQTRPLWKDACEKAGIRIEVEQHPPGGPVRVDGDAGELRTVLYNIIRNSVQAMPAGGRISVTTAVSGGGVSITVADTGIGMDEATRARVFEPFFTTKGYELGKGLGMSTAYAIVAEHGGTIRVARTAPGQGTTLEIRLPGPKGAADDPAGSTRGNEASARVLWVDDEPMIRCVGKEMLEGLGHRADIAASGEEALSLLREAPYDLLITDLGMPAMSGWQLAERIKGKYPEMTVAVVTGWDLEGSEAIQAAHGVAHVLGKPIELHQLRQLVDDVLRRRRGRSR